MSTSDAVAVAVAVAVAPAAPIIDARFAKRLAIANACVPVALLAWDAFHHHLGANGVNFAIRTTGLLGLVCLVLTLAITPLYRVMRRPALVAIRRNLGVAGFSYIALHFFIFYWWDRDRSITSTAHEIVARQYLWFGFGALVLMIPLALTSTDAMLGRLGGKRWKRLHRLTYVAVVAGCIHYFLLVKSDVRAPSAFLGVTAALLLTRLVPKRRKPPKRALWSGELKIERIVDETPDVKTFRFAHPGGGPLPFQHKAGQYLNLMLTIDGTRVNRSYTIASPPTRRDYAEISVKRVGHASAYLHDTWRAGDLVKLSAPAGAFTFEGERERVVLIAGGIGITPMMAVLRALCDRAWPGDIYLVYGARTKADVAFEAELAALGAKHPNLHVLVALSSERGRVTAELVRGFVPELGTHPIMVCGPDAMMTAVRAQLVGIGVPDVQIRQEAFISPRAARDGDMPAGAAEPPLPDGATATITFAKSGITAEITGETTVLEAAEAAGVEIGFECRSGICGQCKTRLVHGNVHMPVHDALTPHDRAKGLVLACQAHPTRDCTVDA